MTTGATLFHSLAGRWTLSRVIEPGIGTLVGTATLRPLRSCMLHYREDGQLRLATGYTGRAYREYLYVLDDEQLRVCFADGERPGQTLHTLRLQQPDDAGGAGSNICATDVHLCAADSYEGSYRFDGNDEFTISMRVTGPAKNYLMTTAYRRI